MPTIELMMLDYEGTLGVRPDRVFNLGSAVGRGAPNRPGDVMLIQAMFKVIKNNHGSPYFLDIRTLKDAPLSEPTGRMDHGTMEAINTYQFVCRRILLAADGRIDPASFAGRKLRLNAEKKTTIQCLNEQLSVLASINNGGDHTLWLLNLYPKLKAHVRDITTGNANVNVG